MNKNNKHKKAQGSLQPDNQEKQKLLQQKYVEYQMIEQQIKQMQEQLEKMEAQTAEITNVSKSIKDISKAKQGEDVLVPVSNGVFFRAGIKDTASFLVNVGSGVVVKKNLEETETLLNEQHKELESYKEQVVQQLAVHLGRYQELENELKEIVE
jgi:prefoldin alpha subunit